MNTCILYCKTVPGDSNWRYTAKYCTTVELLWTCTGFSTRSFNTALIQFIWLLLLANTRHNSTHPNALHTSTEKTVAGYYKPALVSVLECSEQQQKFDNGAGTRIHATFDPPVQFETFHRAIAELNALYTMAEAAVELTGRSWSYERTSERATAVTTINHTIRAKNKEERAFASYHVVIIDIIRRFIYAKEQRKITRLMEKVIYITLRSWIPLRTSFLVFGAWTEKNLY